MRIYTRVYDMTASCAFINEMRKSGDYFHFMMTSRAFNFIKHLKNHYGYAPNSNSRQRNNSNSWNKLHDHENNS